MDVEQKRAANALAAKRKRVERIGLGKLLDLTKLPGITIQSISFEAMMDPERVDAILCGEVEPTREEVNAVARACWGCVEDFLYAAVTGERDYSALGTRPAVRNLIGFRFGDWVVIEKISKTHHRCRCICGVERNVRTDNLKCGGSQSCGCRGRVHPDYVAPAA